MEIPSKSQPPKVCISAHLDALCKLILIVIAFKCIHLWKERAEKDNIFDPTPSSQVSYKVKADSYVAMLDSKLEFQSKLGDIRLHRTASGVAALPPFILPWMSKNIGKSPAR